MTDRSLKLTRVLSKRTTKAINHARIFIGAWFLLFSVLEQLLTENDREFVRKVFDAACVALGTKLTSTAAYISPTVGQTGRYCTAFEKWLCLYIGERPNDRDKFV